MVNSMLESRSLPVFRKAQDSAPVDVSREGAMNVVLISTYELGRQPFSISSPAVWLRQAGCNVSCLDLAVQSLSAHEHVLATADLIAFSLPMLTATSLPPGLLRKIKDI